MEPIRRVIRCFGHGDYQFVSREVLPIGLGEGLCKCLTDLVNWHTGSVEDSIGAGKVRELECTQRTAFATQYDPVKSPLLVDRDQFARMNIVVLPYPVYVERWCLRSERNQAFSFSKAVWSDPVNVSERVEGPVGI